jgi:putative ABC transport system permease protein
MFKHYVNTAARHLSRHKLTAAINVTCLTIGLVCFLASFSMVTFLSSSDSHYENTDRTYIVRWAMNGSLSASASPYLAGKYLRTDMPELATVARATIDIGIRNEAPIAAGDRKSFAHVSYADPEILDVFNLPFLAGDSRNALRAPRSAILSERAAVQFFDSPAAALGKRMRLQDGTEITVRGVVGKLKRPSHITTDHGWSMGQLRFDVLASIDVLETSPSKNISLDTWKTPFFLTYAVLPKNGSIDATALRARLATFGQRYADDANSKFRFDATSLKEYSLSNIGVFIGNEDSGAAGATIFYILGCMVLLISCLNYSNLATAQGATRAKEIGMRRIVGARRWQIISQFLSEAAVLATVSLLCAIVVTSATLAAIGSSSVTSVTLATLGTVRFWGMLAAVLIGVTLTAGIYPALVLSNVRPIHAVRAGKSRSGGKLVSRLMVAIQFAGASFLIIAMLVMYTQNRELQRVASVADSTTLISLANDVNAAGVDFDLLKTELLRQPHIEAVSASIVSPWVLIGGHGSVADSPGAIMTRTPVMMNRVHYDFFETLGIELLAGRTFNKNQNDETATGQPSVIVDRAFAEQRGWIPVSAAIGKTIHVVNEESSSARSTASTVIGVVESRATSIVSPTGARSSVYRLVPGYAGLPIIRISATNISAALREIESVWTRLAPSIAMKAEFADQILASNHRIFGIVTLVFGGVAALALTISLLGLIGMSIDVIGRRRHEIGVRKSLGASVQSIVRLLLTDFSKPVVIANLLMWPLAYIAMQFYLSVFSQRVSLSLMPFAISLAMIVAIAWAAVAAQATQAARLNPATVLRYE